MTDYETSLSHVHRFLFSAVLIACASTPARNPVPAEMTTQVGIQGVPEARRWADEWPRYSIERFETYSDEEFHIKI